MLYVFQGSDVQKSREKVRKLIETLRVKRPDAAFVTMNGDDWDAESVRGHLGGQGLFSNKYIVFLDRVSENDVAEEELASLAPALNQSENIFIVLQSKSGTELKKILEKSAEKTVVTDLPIQNKFAKSSKDFNIFALADAIGSRDLTKGWTIFRQAIDNGLDAESIAGTIFWQIKSMILASGSKSAGDCGLSPFVFSKSKKYAGNYKPEELEFLSKKIIGIYHDAHRGIGDLELEIERLLLDIK